MVHRKKHTMVEVGQKFIIKLTEKECAGARYVDIRDCPIARAFKKLGYKSVRVNPNNVRWNIMGSAKAVVSKTDRKLYGEYGRNSMHFIKPLIHKANKGETFVKHIKFVRVS